MLKTETKAVPNKIDAFTLAYIECALWSSTDESDEAGGEPLDANYDIDDIAPEAMERMTADCAKFQAMHRILLVKARYDLREYREWSNAELAGHDFWLTRNDHGAGYWDRGLGEVGDKLTDAAKAFGECWLYVGDDDKIHVM